MAITRFIGASDKLWMEWMTQGQSALSLWLTDLLQSKGPVSQETSGLLKKKKKTCK